VRGEGVAAKLVRKAKVFNAKFVSEASWAWIHRDYNGCPDGPLSGLLFLKAAENLGLRVSEMVRDVPEYHMIREGMKYTGKLTQGKFSKLGTGVKKILGKNSSVETKIGLRVSTETAGVIVQKSG